MPGKPTSKVWISADQLHEGSNGLTLITATLSKRLSQRQFQGEASPWNWTFRTFTARRPSNAANISLVVILRDGKMGVDSTPKNWDIAQVSKEKLLLDLEKPLSTWGADQFNGTWTVSCDLKRIKTYMQSKEVWKWTCQFSKKKNHTKQETSSRALPAHPLASSCWDV